MNPFLEKMRSTRAWDDWVTARYGLRGYRIYAAIFPLWTGGRDADWQRVCFLAYWPSYWLRQARMAWVTRKLHCPWWHRFLYWEPFDRRVYVVFYHCRKCMTDHKVMQ